MLMGKYTKVDKKYYEIQRDQRIGETMVILQKDIMMV